MSANDLTVSRVLKAPRAAIWKAWADPDLFVRWFAPAPIVTTVQEHDLRPGGGFSNTMRMADGTEFGGRGCFLEVAEGRRIVFTDALQAGWRPNAEPFFTAVITMEDHPEGTLYTATALHATEENRRKHQEMGFETGWGICIEQLGEVAAGLA